VATLDVEAVTRPKAQRIYQQFLLKIS